MSALQRHGLVLASSEGGGGGNFLVTPELGLMLWTLLAFGVTLILLRKLAFPRIQDGAREAQPRDRRVDRRGRAHAQGGRPDPGRVPRAPARGARAGRRDRRPRAQGRGQDPGRGPHHREGHPRGDARGRSPRHRAGDAPRDRPDPPRGRRPDRARDREGRAQDAQRRRPQAADRRGAPGVRLLAAARRRLGRPAATANGSAS